MPLYGKTTYHASADAPELGSKSFGQARACPLFQDFIALLTLLFMKGLNSLFQKL
jgi:hypothetical protein